jgi:hypothetical protein
MALDPVPISKACTTNEACTANKAAPKEAIVRHHFRFGAVTAAGRLTVARKFRGLSSLMFGF